MSDNVKETIAKNLLYYRKKNKITQKELAEQLGVKHNAISAWENGVNSIDIDTLFRICKIFGVTVNDMYGMRSSEQPTTIGAHFDGDEYTEEELDKIKEFAAFVKSTRKSKDIRMAQKTAPVPAATEQPLAFPDHLAANAAHSKTGATQEEKQHDDDIMDNDDEWK